jgi:hypothetical protein
MHQHMCSCLHYTIKFCRLEDRCWVRIATRNGQFGRLRVYEGNELKENEIRLDEGQHCEDLRSF